jgi:uncharacterized membrane protein YfcA
MEIWIIYLLFGAFAGLTAGLLGVGGGLIIVPVLAWIFNSYGFSQNIIMHLAVGTSLATIIFTSISSIIAHHKHQAVLWQIVYKLTPGIIAGAWAGAAIADFLPTRSMKIFFGLFELFVALQMTLNIKPKPHRQLPATPAMGLAGGIIGSISSIIGIGGGTLTVPFLVWCNITMHKAVATSAACGLPIAIAGTIGYVIAGLNENNLPTNSTGYIYWPALLGITTTSILFAPLGAKLAHKLPVNKLKHIFAILLFTLAFKMLFY